MTTKKNRSNNVYVEVVDGKIIRIIRPQSDVWKLDADQFDLVSHGHAVSEIRKQVFKRANGECELCGALITEQTGELHEMLPKGNGGEVSIANSKAICHGCHTGRWDSEHGDRRWNGRKVV